MQIFKNHTQLSDEDLIQRYKTQKERKIIGEIWDRYSRLIYGLCLKYFKSQADALDAVNGIFEKLIIKLETQEIEYFKAWIYTFSKNYCLEIIRKQQRRREIFIKYKLEKDDSHFISEIEELNDDSLIKAIDKLPEHQKLCLQLFYFQDYSYQEISIKTGFNSGQVKSHLQNGRRNLKNTLKSENYEI